MVTTARRQEWGFPRSSRGVMSETRGTIYSTQILDQVPTGVSTILNTSGARDPIGNRSKPRSSSPEGPEVRMFQCLVDGHTAGRVKHQEPFQEVDSRVGGGREEVGKRYLGQPEAKDGGPRGAHGHQSRRIQVLAAMSSSVYREGASHPHPMITHQTSRARTRAHEKIPAENCALIGKRSGLRLTPQRQRVPRQAVAGHVLSARWPSTATPSCHHDTMPAKLPHVI